MKAGKTTIWAVLFLKALLAPALLVPALLAPVILAIGCSNGTTSDIIESGAGDDEVTIEIGDISGNDNEIDNEDSDNNFNAPLLKSIAEVGE